MLKILPSVALAIGSVLLSMQLVGCGQKGNLYLPAESAAANRATLPQAIGNSVKSTLPSRKASAPAQDNEILIPSPTSNTP